MSDQHAVDSLQRIIGLGEKLLTMFDVEELLTMIVRHVKELLHVEGATLYLIDPIERLMISQVILSDRVEEIVLDVDNNSIAGYTALHRESLNIPDAYGDLTHIHPDLRFNKSIDEQTQHRTETILTHPLLINGELIGVFQMVNKEDGPFNDKDLMVLKNFSVIAGIAIMNARLMERVMDEQANAFEIIEHISELVIVQDPEGNILHLNMKAAGDLPEGVTPKQAQGKKVSEMFPLLAGLQNEVNRVIEQNLDKAVSGGKLPYVILTRKNSKRMVEKVILLIREYHEVVPEPDGPPPDPTPRS